MSSVTSAREDCGGSAPRCWRWRCPLRQWRAPLRSGDCQYRGRPAEPARRRFFVAASSPCGTGIIPSNNILFTAINKLQMPLSVWRRISAALPSAPATSPQPGDGSHCNLPAFGTQGTRMDVTVSALGDFPRIRKAPARSPPLGADGNVYAVAQGSLAIGGSRLKAKPELSVWAISGVPDRRPIANGAIVEREIDFALNRLPNVRLALCNADLHHRQAPSLRINDYLGAKAPSRSILHRAASIQREFRGNVVAMLTEIEQLQVDPTSPPRS